jgi:hypothetical protein
MSINYSTKDLENRKFRECPDGSGEVVVATEICNVNELANAINGDDNGVSQIQIINYSVSANVSQAHTFPNGTNRIRIKTLENHKFDVSTDDFTTGDVYTVDAGCEWAEDRIYLQSNTLYFKSNKIVTLQIMQWY